jgi:hypothetical protein
MPEATGRISLLSPMVSTMTGAQTLFSSLVASFSRKKVGIAAPWQLGAHNDTAG